MDVCSIPTEWNKGRMPAGLWANWFDEPGPGGRSGAELLDEIGHLVLAFLFHQAAPRE